MRSASDVISLANTMRSRYADRDARYENAWLAYKGDYDQMMGGGYQPVNLQDTRSVAANNTQVWNLIKPIVDTHRYLINRSPAIRVPASQYGMPEEAGKAERIEKLLYAIGDASQLSRRHGEAAFDIALYFATVWMVRWDKELDHPLIVGRSPKGCYPITKRHGDELAACIFMWEEFADELAENVPESASLLGAEHARRNQKVDVIEYIDTDSYQLVIGGKSKNISPWGGKHNLGYVPVAITAGGHIRGELFPPGAIDQLVAVNDHLNRFQTKWGDALEGVLFGWHDIEGPGANEVVLNRTPGGVTRITDPDTHHTYKQPQAPPREVFAQLQEIQSFMRTHAMWPTSASGESDASVITGKAVSRLQGVMASMAAEADDNLGRDLSRCNSWALQMMEQYRPKKKFVLYSGAPLTALSAPGRPSGFTVEIIPERDIQGYYRNELVYSPFGSDVASALNVGMQGVQADIISRRAMRDMWPGVNDSEGMAKEIDEEKSSRMRLEMKLQAEAQQAAQQIQMQAQQQMMAPQGAAPSGQPPSESAPPPGPPAEGGAPPGAPGPGGAPMPPDMAPGTGTGPVILPEGRPFAMGMGEPLTGADNFPLPTENVLPYNQALEQLVPEGKKAGPASEMGPDAISIDEVQEAIAGVQKLKGKVFIMGELAKRGAVTGMIELGITDKLDKATLINGMPQYKGKLDFTILGPMDVPAGAVQAYPPEGAENAPTEMPPEGMPPEGMPMPPEGMMV